MFCGVAGAGAGAGAGVCAMNGLGASLEPPKPNELPPKPLAVVPPPNKLVIAGLAGCMLAFGKPNVGFACICGSFAGVEVAPVSGIENVKLLDC